MKDRSIWLDENNTIKYSKLGKNITCDILIIGGGITGISCGYFFKDSKKHIVLVEANQIGSGSTGKSTGKLSYLQDDMINKIKSIHGSHISNLYIDSQKDAIKLVKKIIIDNNLNCSLEPASSYIFSKEKFKNIKIKQNFELYKNYPNISVKRKKLPYLENICKVIEANDTYVFNPVKFCREISKIISKKIEIYENTRIIDIAYKHNYYIACTSTNLIKCKKIILACHYPSFNLPFFLPLRTTIEKSFLCAGETNTTRPISLINIDKDIISLRYYKREKDYLIFLCNNKNLNSSINDLKIKDDCIWKMRTKLTPKIKYCWSNCDIMTYDYLPFVGKLSNNIYIATGYNTWGLTSGVLAGKILYDIISNKSNKYSDIFNPTRNLKFISNLFTFNSKNILSFLKSKIFKQKLFYKPNVKIINENGVDYGIYIDENKKVHKVFNKCPHMKCNLYFNYQTKTWDCPCHSSSFDIDGNVIYGPANKNIKIN